MPTALPSRHSPPIGFAHRGAGGRAPENTIEAFDLALRMGSSGLGSEVWLTADGVAVLEHSGVVGRLRRHRIPSLRRDELPGHIPTLRAVFETCGIDFDLALDIRDPAAFPEVLATCRDVGSEDRLWACHGDIEVLAGWRELSPTVHLTHATHLKLMDGGAERHAAMLAADGIDAVHLHHSEWNGGLTTLVHRFELFALASDAQFPHILDALLLNGIDGIFSDHVDLLVEAISRLSSPPT